MTPWRSLRLHSYAGIGSDTNESQYLGLLNAANTGGMYVSLDDLSSKMDTINTYILQSVLSKDYSIDKYITTDDIITYKGYYPLSLKMMRYMKNSGSMNTIRRLSRRRQVRLKI